MFAIHENTLYSRGGVYQKKASFEKQLKEGSKPFPKEL